MVFTVKGTVVGGFNHMYFFRFIDDRSNGGGGEQFGLFRVDKLWVKGEKYKYPSLAKNFYSQRLLFKPVTAVVYPFSYVGRDFVTPEGASVRPSVNAACVWLEDDVPPPEEARAAKKRVRTKKGEFVRIKTVPVRPKKNGLLSRRAKKMALNTAGRFVTVEGTVFCLHEDKMIIFRFLEGEVEKFGYLNANNLWVDGKRVIKSRRDKEAFLQFYTEHLLSKTIRADVEPRTYRFKGNCFTTSDGVEVRPEFFAMCAWVGDVPPPNELRPITQTNVTTENALPGVESTMMNPSSEDKVTTVKGSIVCIKNKKLFFRFTSSVDHKEKFGYFFPNALWIDGQRLAANKRNQNPEQFSKFFADNLQFQAVTADATPRPLVPFLTSEGLEICPEYLAKVAWIGSIPPPDEVRTRNQIPSTKDNAAGKSPLSHSPGDKGNSSQDRSRDRSERDRSPRLSRIRQNRSPRSRSPRQRALRRSSSLSRSRDRSPKFRTSRDGSPRLGTSRDRSPRLGTLRDRSPRLGTLRDRLTGSRSSRDRLLRHKSRSRSPRSYRDRSESPPNWLCNSPVLNEIGPILYRDAKRHCLMSFTQQGRRQVAYFSPRVFFIDGVHADERRFSEWLRRGDEMVMVDAMIDPLGGLPYAALMPTITGKAPWICLSVWVGCEPSSDLKVLAWSREYPNVNPSSISRVSRNIPNQDEKIEMIQNYVKRLMSKECSPEVIELLSPSPSPSPPPPSRAEMLKVRVSEDKHGFSYYDSHSDLRSPIPSHSYSSMQQPPSRHDQPFEYGHRKSASLVGDAMPLSLYPDVGSTSRISQRNYEVPKLESLDRRNFGASPNHTAMKTPDSFERSHDMLLDDPGTRLRPNYQDSSRRRSASFEQHDFRNLGQGFSSSSTSQSFEPVAKKSRPYESKGIPTMENPATRQMKEVLTRVMKCSSLKDDNIHEVLTNESEAELATFLAKTLHCAVKRFVQKQEQADNALHGNDAYKESYNEQRHPKSFDVRPGSASSTSHGSSAAAARNPGSFQPSNPGIKPGQSTVDLYHQYFKMPNVTPIPPPPPAWNPSSYRGGNDAPSRKRKASDDQIKEPEPSTSTSIKATGTSFNEGPSSSKKYSHGYSGPIPYSRGQFQHVPVIDACWRCGISGHRARDNVCSGERYHCRFCNMDDHVTLVCRFLNSGCDYCGYRGHLKTCHDCDEKGNVILDARRRPSPRDVALDAEHFHHFADQGFYTRHRERFVGYGFWLLPDVLLDKVDKVRYSVLYNRGWEEAIVRIRDMAAKRVSPSQFENPSEPQGQLQ